ncbi:MAG: Glutathione import ATP-binding protein GsiA [Paracidovorax wautersii]|uniref:Glutathione import ATP-binding protein GsiA n=1 Tax=Paracidovorax wautersii TaxID=1177982 RepID=A0A7V8FRW1_9BURK|nr:MAG: Glutathione import ATP-binding protein GsiA [Paracidovorax wautersii]
MSQATSSSSFHAAAARQADADAQIARTDVLLDIQRLNVFFESRRGRHHAVRDLDLRVHRGETVALVGESGCGKSTTALAILRLLAPTARLDGRLDFDGRNILSLAPRDIRDIRGRRISMIFQEPMTSLNPVHTIGDQIIETLREHEEGLSARAARERAIELLELVRLPEPARRVDDYPHNLSGGQRQRVMIAMAVACKPELLIADEPTTALDVTIQAQILELLDRLRRELSMSLLLITHDLGVVSQWADRVAVMYGGRKVEEAPTARLFAQPAHPYTQGLLGASLHAGQSLHYRDAALPEIQARSDAATGQTQFLLSRPERKAWKPAAGQGEAETQPLLQVQSLVTEYASRHGAVRAVDEVSFDIAPGETLGLVGESGCGKSTLSRTLLRLLDPSAGSIRLQGTELAGLTARELLPWRGRVQMVFQDPYASLNPRRTVFDILESALVVHGHRDRAERRRLILQMLDRVGLPAEAAQRYPHEFSGGQRQRIGIARALILKPALVILDEPVSALDVSIQAQILNLLVELRQDFDLSYLFISHDLAVVRYIADRVLVMNGGRIVESGPVAQVWDQPQHAYTQRLIAAA